MTNFRDTAEAAAFVATADSRETSPEVMLALAFFARDLAEAEALWNGDGIGCVANASDIWEHATGNGGIGAEYLFWGGRTLDRVIADLAVGPGFQGDMEMIDALTVHANGSLSVGATTLDSHIAGTSPRELVRRAIGDRVDVTHVWHHRALPKIVVLLLVGAADMPAGYSLGQRRDGMLMVWPSP